MIPVRLTPKKKNKYNARKTVVDGITFDSLGEACRYGHLCILLRSGSIRNLVAHPRFTLEVNGQKICSYIADFIYENAVTGVQIVEDYKGKRTPVYSIKKKLMKACHGVEIVEITK
jgi:hypothetical protein